LQNCYLQQVLQAFSPSLSTFVWDVAGLKTPGRPIRGWDVEIHSNDMTDNNHSSLKDLEAFNPKPSKELMGLCPELILAWNELMALN
jgi:hypothetical protein